MRRLEKFFLIFVPLLAFIAIAIGGTLNWRNFSTDSQEEILKDSQETPSINNKSLAPSSVSQDKNAIGKKTWQYWMDRAKKLEKNLETTKSELSKKEQQITLFKKALFENTQGKDKKTHSEKPHNELRKLLILREREHEEKEEEYKKSLLSKDDEITTLHNQTLELRRQIADGKARATVLMSNSIDLQQLLDTKQILASQRDELLNKVIDYRKTIRKLTGEKEDIDRKSSLLRRKLQQAKNDLDLSKAEITRLKSKEREAFGFGDDEGGLSQIVRTIANLKEERNNLELEVEKMKSVEADNAYLRGEFNRLRSENNRMSKEIEDIKTNRDAREADLAKLQAQLSGFESLSSKITILEQELVKANNEIVLRDTTIELLKSGHNARKDHPLLSENLPRRTYDKKENVNKNRSILTSNITQPKTNNYRNKAQNDALIVEVVSPKTNLRTGPGLEHSPLMQIQKGARLTVEAKIGEWFRIITPTGGRAFVRSDMVKEISGLSLNHAPLGQTRINPPPAIDNADDSQAYDFLIRSLQNNLQQ